MNRSSRIAVIVLAAALVPGLAAAFTPQSLWADWGEHRLVKTPAPCFGHDDVVAQLAVLEHADPGGLEVRELGKSAQGRSIELMTLGRGDRPVLLWSQMHGDEPSATPALFDLADYLLAHRADDPDAAAILDRLELLVVPMLNPDGASYYQRENAQAIDINRDALRLSTPEGRLLKQLRDDYEPVLGFNLHDEQRRRTAGDTGVLVTNSVLAVAGDADQTLTPGRERAQRAAVAVEDALAPFFPGGLARYDDTFNPRAFGDNLTAWGTPVLLIESGGVPPPHPFTDLTRANFVAILMTLKGLAEDDLAGYDAARYANIPENDDGDRVDVLVSGGKIRQPGTDAAYRADLPFDVLASDAERAGCSAPKVARSRVREIGDDHLLSAETTIDASGDIVLAPFRVGASGWAARHWLTGHTLARLAALGVAEVTWSVPERRFIEGEKLAAKANGIGRARLVVSPNPLSRTLVRLLRPPEARPAHSLSGIFSLLSRASAARVLGATNLEETLDRLWGISNPLQVPPVLAPDAPASFLIVEPTESDAGELAGDSVVRSIWLGGYELGAPPR